MLPVPLPLAPTCNLSLSCGQVVVVMSQCPLCRPLLPLPLNKVAHVAPLPTHSSDRPLFCSPPANTHSPPARRKLFAPKQLANCRQTKIYIRKLRQQDNSINPTPSVVMTAACPVTTFGRFNDDARVSSSGMSLPSDSVVRHPISAPNHLLGSYQERDRHSPPSSEHITLRSNQPR